MYVGNNKGKSSLNIKFGVKKKKNYDQNRLKLLLLFNYLYATYRLGYHEVGSRASPLHQEVKELLLHNDLS